MGTDHQALFAELEARGEEAVRVDFVKGLFPQGQKANLVGEWLNSKDRSRAADAVDKRDAREERTLSIAEEALAIAKDSAASARLSATAAQVQASSARDQARWAKWAAIVAVVAAIVAVKDSAIALIFGAS
jgi:hypothetical protein